MCTSCPNCGDSQVVAQDIESLSDSVLLVKLEKRIQLCCQVCGWMDFTDPVLLQDFKTESGTARKSEA